MTAQLPSLDAAACVCPLACVIWQLASAHGGLSIVLGFDPLTHMYAMTGDRGVANGEDST